MVDYLEPWAPVDNPNGNLVKELEREINDCHVLFGKQIVAIAQRLDSDDVLFEVKDDSSVNYAVVHLTWSGRTESDGCPDAELFSTFDEWVSEGMAKDNRDYIA